MGPGVRARQRDGREPHADGEGRAARGSGADVLALRRQHHAHLAPRHPRICFNDGPAGIRLTKNVTGFPTGINTASTFSRRLMQARGVAMAEEFRGKGIQCVVYCVICIRG